MIKYIDKINKIEVSLKRGCFLLSPDVTESELLEAVKGYGVKGLWTKFELFIKSLESNENYKANRSTEQSKQVAKAEPPVIDTEGNDKPKTKRVRRAKQQVKS